MTQWGQHYEESCGAACLLCAAMELGVTTLPKNSNFTLWQGGPMPLATSIDCEKRIYQVTSVHPVGSNPDGWGLNMPSKIIACARMLGLKGLAIAYDTWTVAKLKKVFDMEMQELKTMGALRESSEGHSVFKPNPRQRELKVLVDREAGNMHYIMVRNDGTVMDPAPKGSGGTFHQKIDEAKTSLKMHGTGLSVFIQI